MRGLAGTLGGLLMLVLLTACGGDSDEQTDRTTTTVAAPSSTTVTLPPQQEALDCAEGSSPAVFDDDGGTYATHLAAIQTAERRVSFDVVQFLVGDEAVDAYHEDYPDDTEGPPNDYYVVNESAQVREAPVADDVTVRLVRLSEDADADLDAGSFEELAEYVDAQPQENGTSTAVYWLSFDAGSVTEICEQYVP